LEIEEFFKWFGFNWKKIIKSWVILSLPVLLFILVYLLPSNITSGWEQDASEPSLLNEYLSSVNHKGFEHLKGNSVNFITMAFLLAFIYQFYFRDFKFLLFIYATVLLTPLFEYLFIYNLGNPPNLISVGASGLVSALMGIVLAISLYLWIRPLSKVPIFFQFGFFFILMTVISLTYEVSIKLVSTFFLGLIFVIISKFDVLKSVNIFSEFLKNPRRDIPIFLTFISVLAIFFLFPPSVQSSNGVTNILSHYSGLVFGYFLSCLYPFVRNVKISKVI